MGFNLFEMLRQNIPGVLHCSKCQEEVKLSDDWGLVLIEKQK